MVSRAVTLVAACSGSQRVRTVDGGRWGAAPRADRPGRVTRALGHMCVTSTFQQGRPHPRPHGWPAGLNPAGIRGVCRPPRCLPAVPRGQMPLRSHLRTPPPRLPSPGDPMPSQLAPGSGVRGRRLSWAGPEARGRAPAPAGLSHGHTRARLSDEVTGYVSPPPTRR